MHKTSAWPLALVYVGLIFYASLYPFSGWRDQGIAPWAFLSGHWSPYWTGFDVGINVVGYMPLGFLLVLSALRSERPRFAVCLAILVAGMLSLGMESLQVYLPLRVPSSLDLGLNIAGAWMGGLTAWALEKLGVIDRWSIFRARWFVADARGGMVLLFLWPLSLLFPAPVPFGIGQVLERLEVALADLLDATPFLNWLPVRTVELQPLAPVAELFSVVLGLLIPCLLGFCIIRSTRQRIFFLLLIVLLGVAVTALSAALSYGPLYAWIWLTWPVRVGLVTVLALTLLMLGVPRRASAALVLLALGLHLSLLNHAPANPYFAQTLAAWEQGRFIRFHGLVQWLGWLWPYATLVYVLTQVWKRESKN
jgi:VanZ family protein